MAPVVTHVVIPLSRGLSTRHNCSTMAFVTQGLFKGQFRVESDFKEACLEVKTFTPYGPELSLVASKEVSSVYL